MKLLKPTKPNLFLRPASSFNSGAALTTIEVFKEKLGDKGCYITNLQTPNSFLTSHENENFGYELQIEKPNLKIVQSPVDMDLKNCTFICYDLETTGLNAKYDDITEIGAVKVTIKNGKVVKKEEFHRYIKQTKPLKPFISRLTHLTDDFLNKNGIDQAKALKEFKNFCGDNPMMGHNIINFDARFLNKKAQQLGLKRPSASIEESYFNNSQIDTMEISRLMNSRPNHTLRSMAQDLNQEYDLSVQHSALADVYLNLYVYLNSCIPFINDHDIKNLKDVNSLKSKNYFYSNQHTKLRVIAYPNQKAKAKLQKWAQENNLNLDNILTLKQNVILTNNPSSEEILSSFINDNINDFENTINKYDFISLPPIKFWTNQLSTQESTKILDLSNANDKLLYENKKELINCLKKCVSNEDKAVALSKSKIFKNLKINLQNVTSILSKIDYLTNPLCDTEEKKIDGVPSVVITYKTDPALSLKQLQDAYKGIITACENNNIPVVIDNEIYVTDKKHIKDFVESCANLQKNPYKRFIRTADGVKVYKHTSSDIEKDLVSFLPRKKVKEILYHNPEEIYKKLLSHTKSFHDAKEQGLIK